MKTKMIICNLLISLFLSNYAIAEEHRFPEIPRISAILAHQKYQSGKAVLVDAMKPRTFFEKHILGSINIPNDGPQDIARAREMLLPFYPEQEIIVYCM